MTRWLPAPALPSSTRTLVDLRSITMAFSASTELPRFQIQVRLPSARNAVWNIAHPLDITLAWVWSGMPDYVVAI